MPPAFDELVLIGDKTIHLYYSVYSLCLQLFVHTPYLTEWKGEDRMSRTKQGTREVIAEYGA